MENSWDLGCRGRDSNPRSHGIPGISQSTALLPYEPPAEPPRHLTNIYIFIITFKVFVFIAFF